MPTISSHVSDEFARTVETAAAASAEKKVGPYIAEAVRRRLEREGMLPGDPQAEVLASAGEVGFEDANQVLKRVARLGATEAIAALDRASRRTKRQLVGAR